MTAAPRVLFLAHSHAFGPFRVGSHHYARTLAQRGAEVVHLSTPISLAHRLTGRVDRATDAAVPRGPHRDADGVTHLVPRTLVPAPYGRFVVSRELERHGLPTLFDVVYLDQPLLWDASVRELAERLVYRPTDLYPGGIKRERQATIVAAADGVIATSAAVLADLGRGDIPGLVIENGVDAGRFTATDGAERPPVCVYVGALDSRFDWEQVRAWAERRPDVEVVVAGPTGVVPEGLPGNVRLPGAVPYADLPALLHRARVGLLPLSADPSNVGRSPMKLYEYLAAGLSVVARETSVLHDDPASGVVTYRDAQSAAAAFDAALSLPSPNHAGIRRAAAESWDVKATLLQEFAQALPIR